MKIFITSYTYIYEHNYKLFKYFQNKSNLILILPKSWGSTKGNKVTTHAPVIKDLKIIITRGLFYHSKYPLVRGQLKGWMPWLWFILRKQSRPGDVFFSSYEPNLFVTYIYCLIAKNLRLKHVFFTWQNVPYQNRMSGIKLWVTEWLLKKNIELSWAGVCGMQKALEVHGDYFHKYNPHLKIGIFNQSGVDIEIFSPGAKSNFREKYNLIGKKVIVYSATFTARKGPLQTIEAFARLSREMPDVRLVIIGTGELRSKIEEAINDLGIKDMIIMLGWQAVDDLAPIYAQSDVMVHPSVPFDGWEEQWGLLMLQAQACGTPVITSRTGSLEETVLDGQTGILIDSVDPNSIYIAMKRLLSDDGLRTKMGQASREYIVDHFSYQSTAKRMELFFNSL